MQHHAEYHKTSIYLIWKKYQVFTPIAERMLEMVKERFTV